MQANVCWMCDDLGLLFVQVMADSVENMIVLMLFRYKYATIRI